MREVTHGTACLCEGKIRCSVAGGFSAASQPRNSFKDGVAHRVATDHKKIFRATFPNEGVGIDMVSAKRFSHCGKIALFYIRAVIHLGNPHRDSRLE